MPATRKHLHISKPRRRQRSVSLNTRASRCGVKNYLNVLKSLHPTVDSFFPVTKQYLQEYIDAKKKQGTIKANSLDQYFQHIESYNMALNYGWESQEFEPMMREVLEELIEHEEKSGVITTAITTVNAVNTVVATDNTVDSNGNNIIQKNPTSSLSPLSSTTRLGEIDDLNHLNSNSNSNSNSNNSNLNDPISLVCFDTTRDPIVKIERNLRVSISNVDQNDDPNLVIQQLIENIASLKLPKKWGTVDTSVLYYRLDTCKDAQHYELRNEIYYKSFWDELSKRKMEVQLIVYTRQPAINAPLTPRKSPPRLQQISGFDYNSDSSTHSPTFIQLKSVTIRSPNRIYKQNIAITDKTTFSSLLAFAIKKSAPQGKQFVLQSADGELEYMPEDPVRKVIHGKLHVDVVVKMEDIDEVDFTKF